MSRMLLSLLLCPLLIGFQAPLSLLTGHNEKVTPSSPQVTVHRNGAAAEVSIASGADDYPGVTVAAPGKGWNLSKFGQISATVRNTGTTPLTLSLRVDDDGNWQDNPWNAESTIVAPGELGMVTVIFGYSYGFKPGHRLKSAVVPRVLLFTGKTSAPVSFTLESIEASGPAGEKPPTTPDQIRIVPKEGWIYRPGLKPAIVEKNTSHRSTDSGIEATFQSPAPERWIGLEPEAGRWDLRDYDRIRVKLRNTGGTPVIPTIRLESNGGESYWGIGKPLSPGATQEIEAGFAGSAPFNLTNATGGSKLTSDSISEIRVGTDLTSLGKLRIEEVRAFRSAASVPDWLGKRPPIPGNWVVTLREEFSGNQLNRRVWRDVGENYYDKVSHWSKENVVLGGGFARLRFAKKTGFQNDDPKRNSTPYASGYLDTYGLWKQRYGYFEARMKIPDAPGLWPAFWMMPDRGIGDQGQRQDTGNGGMEFDIMENLTRWGTRRYNIAMHYDGYGKDHKALGSDKVYVQPDKDGFLTCGLLWTPGSAIFYCNGREVLRWENPRISNVPSILMFTLPSGGWDNDALDHTKLPADFVIDYVRVWQRRDLLKE